MTYEIKIQIPDTTDYESVCNLASLFEMELKKMRFEGIVTVEKIVNRYIYIVVKTMIV